MAGRIRSIKPEILEDEKTAALPHFEWRLFVSLWLIADDYGNLRGDPTYVLGQTLWAANETRETVAAALDNLAVVGLLARYAVRGQGYYHITGWAKHQKVDKPGKPRMPGPGEADTQQSQDVASAREGLAESSRMPREGLAESSRMPRESLAPDLRPPTETPNERLSPPRAIVPTPEQAPKPAPPLVPAVPTVPAASPQAPARENIAGTQLGDRSYDPASPLEIGRLAEVMWHRISDAAIATAAELGLPAPLPFPVITPSTNRRGFVELKDRIREEGALAPAVCDRVVKNLVRQARSKESVEWLAEKVFGDKAWVNARNGIDPSSHTPTQRAGPRGSAERAPSNEPPRRQLKTL